MNNISDKELDKLTRSLLEEGLETPSPDLGLRIMDRIMQEAPLAVPETGEMQQAVRKVKMKSSLNPFAILGFLILYLVVGGLLFVLLTRQPGGASHALDGLKDKLPFILTMAAVVGSLVFYSTLDRILLWGK